MSRSRTRQCKHNVCNAMYVLGCNQADMSFVQLYALGCWQMSLARVYAVSQTGDDSFEAMQEYVAQRAVLDAFEAHRAASDSPATAVTPPATKAAAAARGAVGAAAPALPPPVHLLTATASLSQACGATRLLLAGHDAPVVKV